MHIAKMALLLLFMHPFIESMDIVPVQNKWHLLAPDMVYGCADKLDFYSCDSLRLSCKNYHRIIDHEYWNTKTKQMYSIAPRLDVDLYTKNLIFYCSSPSGPHIDLIWLTNEENKRETNAIRYLAGLFDKDLWKWERGLYDAKFREALFKAYASDFERDKRDWETPSTCFGGLQIIRLILHQTGNINFQNEEGNTLLHCAKRRPQYEYLLQQPDIDVNILNKKGESPLLYAIKYPTKTAYNCSEDKGGYDINWYLAAALLADARADIKIKTNKGKTLLHYASKCASSTVKTLIERFTQDDLIAVDNKGRTALYLAVKHCNRDAVELLFPQFPDHLKYAVDKDGKTLLHVGTMHKYCDSKTVKYLLAQFPQDKKYIRDHNGKTFLDYAYETDNLCWLLGNERGEKYVVSEEDMNTFLSYSFGNYGVALVLGHKTALFVGLLFSMAAYCYMKK